MQAIEFPINAGAFDDLSNSGFLQICNAISLCVSRDDLEFRAHLKGRHIDVVYHAGGHNTFGISTVRILMPSEVLRDDVVEDFEIIYGDAIISIERQRNTEMTLQRIAGAIEACLPKEKCSDILLLL